MDIRPYIPIASGLTGLVAVGAITASPIMGAVGGAVMAGVGFVSQKFFTPETDDTEHLKKLVEQFTADKRELQQLLTHRTVGGEEIKPLTDPTAKADVEYIISMMRNINFFLENQADLTDIRRSQYFMTTCPQLAVSTAKLFNHCENFPPSEKSMEQIRQKVYQTLELLKEDFALQYDGYLKHEAVQVSIDAKVLEDMAALQPKEGLKL